MEGQGDHGLHRGQIHIHTAVVVGHIRGIQLFIIRLPAVQLQILPGILVRAPDGGQAGGLCGHHIHPVAEVRGHGRHARPHKLHHLILHVAILKHSPDNRQRDILRACSGLRRPVQIDGDHLGTSHIVGVLQKLLYQLAAAFSHGHGAQRPVAGVAVRTQDHLSAARHHLPHVLVDHRDVRGNIDAAVFFRRGEAEHVVIFVDGAAHRAEGVVAVGQHIGQGKMVHARGLGRLHNSHKGDVMGRH